MRWHALSRSHCEEITWNSNRRFYPSRKGPLFQGQVLPADSRNSSHIYPSAVGTAAPLLYVALLINMARAQHVPASGDDTANIPQSCHTGTTAIPGNRNCM